MKTELKLSGIEQTILLPLWGRVKETNKPNGLMSFVKINLQKKVMEL